MYVVDRRLNPGGKSLENRQRFLRRAKAQVQRAVSQSVQKRDITDILNGGEVSIPLDGIGDWNVLYGPDGFAHLTGGPTEQKLYRPAEDRDSARRIWAEAEQLTGASFPTVPVAR